MSAVAPEYDTTYTIAMTRPKLDKIAAIIVAAGKGQRAGPGAAKQWRTIAGQRIIDHTIGVFRDHPLVTSIIVALPAGGPLETFDGARSVHGASSRAGSVRAALDALRAEAPDAVLIHDVARPCVDPRTISDVIAALDTTPGAAPAVPVTDALWTGTDGRVTGTQDRTGLYRAQTPQGFWFDAIYRAQPEAPADAADDVAIARAAGLDVTIVPGDEDNLKITYPQDFARAEQILETRFGHPARKRV